MTQRERQATGGTTPLPSIADRHSHTAPAARGVDAAPNWNDFFPHLPAVQQQLLLALAAEQGVVNVRQLPATNGTTDAARHFFAPLFHGHAVGPLPPVTPAPVDPIDTALTEEQRHAVAKAILTPDVCLIRGLPGTGKSRVIAEIVRQAARRHLRVLFASPTPAALDVVLDRLADDPAVLPLRCLGSDEPAESLSKAAAKATAAALTRQVGEATVAHARRSAAEAETRVQRLEADSATLAELARLAERLARVPAELAECDHRLANVEAEVPACPNLGAAACAANQVALAEFDAILKKTGDDVQKAGIELAEADALLEKLRSLADDRQHMRLLSRNFWKSFSESDLPKRLDEANARRAELQKRLTDATDEQTRALSQRDAAVATWEKRKAELIAAEAQRRRAECEGKRAVLRREADELHAAWNRTAGGLSADCPRLEPTPAAVTLACNAMNLDASRHEAEFARRWADAAATHADELSARLIHHVNLTAIPLSALAADDLIRRDPFDLLILDEAHRLTDVEFYAVARRAARWVLVGEPVPEATAAEPEREDRGPRRGGAATATRPRGKTAAKVFALPKLWQTLHCEIWRTDAGRVRCQLRPLSPLDRTRLETESVADEPDIELHIFTPADGPPALVEVVFPPKMTVDQAKAYLYRELNELPVPAAAARWDETPQRISYRFSTCPATRSVELEPGLRESFRECGDCWHTVAFDFDRALWTRERAAAWAAEFLCSHDPARTATLATPHRMRPALANFVSALCYERAYLFAPAPPVGGGHPVEFIPVPGLHGDGGRRRGHHEGNGYARKLPPLRGGAGYEIDLSDPNQREHLHADLRAQLPERGFVNLPEAQAVVRLLESMIASTTARCIAVLPLHATQAELIRILVRRSPPLGKTAIHLIIEPASQFRQRECEVAVVPLTRSHTHRAVPYGDDPLAMPHALTRASQRVIVVGDAGTLTRRAQWDGPLDHLDQAAATRERTWVADLIRQLSGHGPPSAIQLHEGPT